MIKFMLSVEAVVARGLSNFFTRQMSEIFKHLFQGISALVCVDVFLPISPTKPQVLQPIERLQDINGKENWKVVFHASSCRKC